MSPKCLNWIGAALFLVATADTSMADETLKFRVTMHATSVQSQDVGDADGHNSILSRYSGLLSLPDGSVGTTYFTSLLDYTKGAGPVVLTYENFTFNDGSVLWIKSSGPATVEGTKTLFQGTGTVIGGKGRYEGAKGDLTYTGARLVPLAAGADLYLDFIINVKK
jgi:hypothetical protein